MSAILGLTSGDTFATKAFHLRNNRRKIFHDFPVGQFPLTGLLSLMDAEETDSFEFGWWEKRFETPQTTIADNSGNAKLPFGTSASTFTSAAAPLTMVAGTEYKIYVGDTSQFQIRQQILIPDVYVSAGVFTEVKGVITEITDSTTLKFQASQATGAIANTNNASPGGPVGCQVICSGNAVGEGASATTGRMILPVNVKNYTQIFRNAFSFTRTALKVPTEFDKTGIYREKAEDNCRQHMVDMEMAFLFGTKRTDLVVENGETVPRRQTGGLVYFLEQYEAANSLQRGYNGSTALAAVTDVTDDQKRIIPCAGGTVTYKVFNSYMERLFRVTNDKAFEKLCLCGSGHLAAINTFFEGKAQLQKDFTAQKMYGMNLTTWETPFGTIHFKTHPLFSRQAAFRYNGLYLDVQNLKYRALNDSDTTLLNNRQNPDYDGRKDEWLTEAGLEVNMPESCMYIKNMQSMTTA